MDSFGLWNILLSIAAFFSLAAFLRKAWQAYKDYDG
jgi:hypothetical protein